MGGIRRDGLGFRQCDVGVVTNVTDDHLGGGEFKTLTEVAQLKSTVPRAVVPDGASVLNADNPYTVEMAEVAGGEILFFSLDEANPVIRDHLRQGGRAVVLRQTEAGEMLTPAGGSGGDPDPAGCGDPGHDGRAHPGQHRQCSGRHRRRHRATGAAGDDPYRPAHLYHQLRPVPWPLQPAGDRRAHRGLRLLSQPPWLGGDG